MDNVELKPIIDNLTDELENIKSELNKTNCNVEEIRNKVDDLIAENKRAKQLELVEKFRKQPNNTLNKDWMFRIINDPIINTSYYPCITYIDNNQFTHLTFKDYLRQAINIDIIIRLEGCSVSLTEQPSNFKHSCPPPLLLSVL